MRNWLKAWARVYHFQYHVSSEEAIISLLVMKAWIEDFGSVERNRGDFARVIKIEQSWLVRHDPEMEGQSYGDVVHIALDEILLRLGVLS